MSKPLDPAILQQMLHRALGMISTIALSVVVIGDWILSHVANSWAMPPEVQSSVQALLTSVGTLWIFRHFGLAALRADTGVLVDGTLPKQPNGNGDSPAPAPLPTTQPPAPKPSPSPPTPGAKPS